MLHTENTVCILPSSMVSMHTAYCRENSMHTDAYCWEDFFPKRIFFGNVVRREKILFFENKLTRKIVELFLCIFTTFLVLWNGLDRIFLSFVPNVSIYYFRILVPKTVCMAVCTVCSMAVCILCILHTAEEFPVCNILGLNHKINFTHLCRGCG